MVFRTTATPDTQIRWLTREGLLEGLDLLISPADASPRSRARFARASADARNWPIYARPPALTALDSVVQIRRACDMDDKAELTVAVSVSDIRAIPALLAFAGLHQLLRPVLDHLGEVPDIQSQALAGALGLAASTHADRLLISAAVLGLLATAAEERPTLGTGCVADRRCGQYQ
jgi:hypothetical protein